MADHLNAQPHPKAKEALAHVQAVGGQVWVAQTALGPPVKDVKQKQSTFTTNNLYWLYSQYDNGPPHGAIQGDI